jgi:polysaccharide biosynthesis protein PslG
VQILKVRPLLAVTAVAATAAVFTIVHSPSVTGQQLGSPSSFSSGTLAPARGGPSAASAKAAGQAALNAAKQAGGGTAATRGGKTAGSSSAKPPAAAPAPTSTTSTVPATTTTTTTAVPPSNRPTIGISIPALLTESPATQAAWLANVKSIGINSVRIGADWAWISYAGPGTYDWAQLDQEVSSIRAAGMSIDMVVMGTPSWAAVAGESGTDVAQPADPAQFGQFAAAVAQRYAPQGVQDFEIWNEPNNTVFWQPAPNPAAYVQLLQAADTDIKAVDPGATVITGGLAPEATQNGDINEVTFLQDMYADGAKGFFDAVGDHPYSYPALPDSYALWSGWSQMDATPASLVSTMVANGDGNKQIWATEVGAPTGGPDSVGTAGQAEELTQAIDNAKTSSWIGALYLYTYEDSGGSQATDEDWFGLLNADGSAKPSWSAVAAAIG